MTKYERFGVTFVPVCVCVSGYEGVFCHINIDECASQPCLNNGKCVDKINSFHCECPKGA